MKATATHSSRSVGQEVLLDAAQMGSRAHRLRSFWTNLAEPVALQKVISNVQRDNTITVNQILRDGWRTQEVRTTDHSSQYKCNEIGIEMRALPTFTKVRGSRAFRDQGPGMLVRRLADDDTQAYREPDVEEKLIIMGFDPSLLSDERISTEEAHGLIGNAIDLTALSRLLMLAEATAVFTASGSLNHKKTSTNPEEVNDPRIAPSLGAPQEGQHGVQSEATTIRVINSCVQKTALHRHSN